MSKLKFYFLLFSLSFILLNSNIMLNGINLYKIDKLDYLWKKLYRLVDLNLFSV